MFWRQVNLRVIGFLITAVCLLVAAFCVDWQQTIALLAAADRQTIAWAVLFLIATFYTFALRQRALIAVEHPPPAWRIFNILMIGYLSNAVLPARPGDIIRAVLLRQIWGIRLSIALASIVLERVFDILALCALGATASFISQLPPLVVKGLYSLSAAGCGLLIALIVLCWRRDLIGRAMQRFPDLFRHAFARFFAEWLQRFASALNLINAPYRLIASIVLTVAGWSALTLSMMMLMQAFRLEVPPAAALLVLVATNLGAVIPSSPGSLGVYHVMAVLALSAWGVEPSTALAFAIASHVIAIGLHIMLGLGSAWFEGIGMFGLRGLVRGELGATQQGS
jgi:uncharacterized protein (TIRG00374 family)